MKPLVAKTLEIANKRIGTREIGRTNRGPEVDGFARDTGVSSGQPWCAMFTYSNKHDAAEALGVENPFIKSAYTPDIFNWAKERDILIPCLSKGQINRPEPGDDFLVMGPQRIYHTGHVRDVEKNRWRTIEGNSNSEGSNEGYEVASNWREYASRFYWVRWSALCREADNKPLTRVLLLGGRKAADLPVSENISLCPVRKWTQWMSQKLEWRAASDTPIVINGTPLQTEITMRGTEAFVPIRDLVATVKDSDGEAALTIAFDAKTQTVSIARKPQK